MKFILSFSVLALCFAAMAVGLFFAQKILRRGCGTNPDSCQCRKEGKNPDECSKT